MTPSLLLDAAVPHLLLLLLPTVSLLSSGAPQPLQLRARVGRIFIRRAPPQTQPQQPSSMPAWLYYNASLGVVEGVPLAGDVGIHFVPSLSATVEVLDGPTAAAGGVGNGTGCSWRYPTMAAVLVDADPALLKPADLCRLLRDLSGRLRVRIAALQVSPDRTVTATTASSSSSSSSQTGPSLYMLASGPGSANVRRTAGALVTWQVGCGSIDERHLLALERLERLAMTGDLTRWPVLLWYVADRLDGGAISSRMRRAPQPQLGDYVGSQQSARDRGADLAGPAAGSSSAVSGGVVGVGGGLGGTIEGSGAYFPPHYFPNGGVGGEKKKDPDSSKATVAPSASRSTLSVQIIDLPVPVTKPLVRSTEPVRTTATTISTTTAPPPTTITTPGVPLLRGNQELGSREYLFPVDRSTWLTVPPDTIIERATGRGLDSLTSSVQNCGTTNSLSDFGSYNASSQQLVGRPSRRHIGVVLSCRLVVEDRTGAKMLIGFTVRVPQPLAPVPLPLTQPFTYSLGLPFSETIRPERFFTDALDPNLTVCVSLVPNDCGKHFAANSSVQFNRSTNSLYGLVWLRDDTVGPIVSMEVFVVGINRYEKASSIRTTVDINQNYVRSEWVNHVYSLYVDGPADYVDKLTSSTSLLYNTVNRLKDFFVASELINSTYRVDSQIHLRRLVRPVGNSRSLQIEFGYTRNYGQNYCPRMSIIDMAKAMYQHCPDRPKKPQPQFVNSLLPLQPTDLTVTPLDTCTSNSYYSFKPDLFYSADCDAANIKISPAPPSSTASPMQTTPAAPALRVNYAIRGGGRYCLMPFTVYAGQSFYRPIRRPNCVTDASGKRNLTVMRMQLCTQVVAGACQLRTGFIAWNAKSLRFEGIPFDDNVGQNPFVVLVTDPVSGQSVEVELLVTVASLNHQFRYHRVVTTVSADASLTRRDGSGLHDYFRRLYDILSVVMSHSDIYLQLRAPDFMHLRMSQPHVTNVTVSWAYLAANKLNRDRQSRYNTTCPVDELFFLRSQIRQHLETVLKSHSVSHLTTFELLFGDCSRLGWDAIEGWYKLGLHLGPSGRVIEAGRGGGATSNNGVLSGAGGGSGGGGSSVAIGNEDSNVILITVLPACGLVILALLVALGVACCLYRRKPTSAPGRLQQQQQHQQQQQQQQLLVSRQAGRGDLSLLSNKRVPIIFAEELEERPTAPGRPLILPHEKPPAGPLTDYQMQQQQGLIMDTSLTTDLMTGGGQMTFQQPQHLVNGHQSLQRPQQQQPLPQPQFLVQGSATFQQRQFRQNNYAGY